MLCHKLCEKDQKGIANVKPGLHFSFTFIESFIVPLLSNYFLNNLLAFLHAVLYFSFSELCFFFADFKHRLSYVGPFLFIAIEILGYNTNILAKKAASLLKSLSYPQKAYCYINSTNFNIVRLYCKLYSWFFCSMFIISHEEK